MNLLTDDYSVLGNRNQTEKIPLPIPEAGMFPGEVKGAERRWSHLEMKFASVTLGQCQNLRKKEGE